MPSATAWIMTLNGNIPTAVGAHEFAHVLPDAPARTRVPGSPVFMNEAVNWDDEVVPVFDAARFAGVEEEPGVAHYYGIVRYRSSASMPPKFGAVKMRGLPQRVEVDDESACDLPEALAGWRPFTVSCFHHEGRQVPVLDLAALFSGVVGAPSREGGPGGHRGPGSAASGPEDGGGPSVYTDSLATT